MLHHVSSLSAAPRGVGRWCPERTSTGARFLEGSVGGSEGVMEALGTAEKLAASQICGMGL